jgi:hypothetical protein
MTETPSGKRWITQKYRYATSGKPSNQSDAQTKNHLSDHTDAANAKHVKGNSMASMYELEKIVYAMDAQIKVMCEILGIDPTPAPEETNTPDA